jgi:hypothetical protein
VSVGYLSDWRYAVVETMLGFKIITPANWSLPDEVSLRFAPRGVAPGIHPHLSIILSPQLRDDVPLEVRRLFEVARGAMVYAYHFYPLYTLAMEQLFRVGEAAVLAKQRGLGLSSKRQTFSKAIEALTQKGIIDELTSRRMHALRTLRNCASHPDRQSIFPPGSAIGTMERLAEDINALCPF